MEQPVNAWEILHLEPTDDLSAIKKAYSVKLKVHHPEDDPEGYQRLREAYDFASRQAKQKKRDRRREILMAETAAASETMTDKEKQPHQSTLQTSHKEEQQSSHQEMPLQQEESAPIFEQPEEPYFSYTKDLTYQFQSSPLDERAEDPYSAIGQFIEKAAALYSDPKSRVSREKWLELIDDSVLWNLEYKQDASEELLQFIMQHSVLPHEIWMLLESQFQWLELMKEEEIYLDQEEIEEFLPYYEKRLRMQHTLSYKEAAKVLSADFDRFILSKEAAMEAFLDNNLQEAEEQFRVGYGIFPDDPELLSIGGHIMRLTGRLKEALEAFQRAAAIQPEKLNTKLELARILYELGDWKEAASICRFVLASTPEDLDAISLYGKILYKQDKFPEARKQFIQVRKQNPVDVEAAAYLPNIHKKMSMHPEKSDLTKKQLSSALRNQSFNDKLLSLFGSINWEVIVAVILFASALSTINEKAERLKISFLEQLFFSLFAIFSVSNFHYWRLEGLPVLISLFVMGGAVFFIIRRSIRKWRTF